MELQSTIDPNRKRILSIDLLRGIIMIIMALDHTRDFFHKDALTGDPLNAATTTAELYATRWVTHFCAPIFVFLSGLSAWLQAQRKSKKELSFFLISRGIWLMVVDIIVMSFVFSFNPQYPVLLLETLWSIGAGMVVLGLMIHLPYSVILATGAIIVLGHNLLDFLERTGDAPKGLWYKLLHQQAFHPIGGGRAIFVLYPALSWIGLALLGYCCGKLFTHMEPPKRRKVLLTTGVIAIVTFFLLRYINVYGDPRPWSEQEDGMKTVFTFINVQKYPPSLLFMLATIGPALIFLALVQKADGRLARIASVFGRVPLFYFVVHFFIVRIGGIILFFAKGHTMKEGIAAQPFGFTAPGEGFTLGETYLVWIAVVTLMYPLCRWYDRYKTNNKDKKWLSYL